MPDRPLLSASIDELEAAFGRATEYAEFRAIAEELRHRTTARAGKLRWKVGAAMAKARKEEQLAPSPGLPLFKAALAAPSSPPPPPPPPTSPLGVLLARFKLEAPDGRPLHGYRLGSVGYEQLSTAVRGRADRLDEGRTDDAALVVLWASAWFRREYAGGLRKYRDLGAAIGSSISDSQWRALIERGLKWWKRPVIERISGRHRLLTIAVEGGFPVRVLAAGEGWLSRYLNEVVGRLLGLADEPSADDAFAMADAAKDELRDTYRQAAFIALAADLALAIVQLRRFAELTAPGLTPSTVLDQTRPGWRDELPIAADSDAAKALIDGMLSAEKIARGLSGGAGCVRVLRRFAEGWRAGLRLSLSGELKAEALAGLAAPGTRLGVHPHGALARAVGEELAFLDPPGEDGDSWRLRALTRRTEMSGVPLEAKIEVVIQAPNGAARTMAWPGGAPERSDVITFEVDGEDELGPTTLVLAANGSASLRAERVVVAAPSEWAASWQDPEREGTPPSLGTADDGRALWLADSTILIESTDGGLLYCIEPGVDEELRDRIVLTGAAPSGFDGADDVLLFAGRPAVQCLRGRATVQPRADELLWRLGRSDPWRELARHPLSSGVIDVMWRDAKTRFVRDRVRAAVIPQRARVTRERDGDGWRYGFEDFSDFEIRPEQTDGMHVEQRTGSAWAVSFRSNPRRRVTFDLGSSGASRAIRIEVDFPLRDGLAHWDGRIVAPGSQLTPADLADLVAFGEGDLTLCCELKHAEIDVPPHYTLGDRELPLRRLSARVASDLASAGIDAWVRLSFVGSAGDFWSIKPFDSEIRCADGAANLLRVNGLGDGELVLTGRPVAAPCEERQLVSVSLEDALNRRSVALPDDMAGAWWVYLRGGPVVRSRPSIVPCHGTMDPTGGGLAATATIANPSARQLAITACLNAVADGGEQADEDLDWLQRLIASLNGVPASTFDALAALPAAPAALARLLLAADEAAQGGIWHLEAELPFIWPALPLKAWRAAAEAIGQSVVEPLLAAGWELAAAAGIGRRAVDGATARVANLDPAIGVALAAAGLCGRPAALPSILEASQGYVRRTFDRGDKAIGVPKETSLFRTEALSPHLPDWSRYDTRHLEALDAPFAAAAAASARAVLSPAQVRRCKEAMTVDSVYFAEGLTAALLGNS